MSKCKRIFGTNEFFMLWQFSMFKEIFGFVASKKPHMKNGWHGFRVCNAQTYIIRQK